MIRVFSALLLVALPFLGCGVLSSLPEPPKSPAEVARLAVAVSLRADKAALLACMAYAADTSRRDPATDEACGMVATKPAKPAAPAHDAAASAGASGQ
jgi:hypothetical protein